MSMRVLFEAMLIFVVGLVLLPIITSSAAAAQADGNASTSVKLLIGLIPLFYVLILVVGAASYVYFRSK
jgi:hypothetical protein